MNQVAFEVTTVSPDVRYRVRFDKEHGRVLAFVVQLEYESSSGWLPVVRFDTAHGFAHCDRYFPMGL
jgi:hypothetical protein